MKKHNDALMRGMGGVLCLFLAALMPVQAAGDGGPRAAPDHNARSLTAATAQQPGPKTAAQAAAIDALKERFDDLTVRWSPLTGSPSRVHSLRGPLTGPTQGPPEEIARQFLMGKLSLLNLAPEDISQLRTSRNYRTQHNGLTHLTFQQQVNGLDVFGGKVKINVDSEGRVLNLSGEPMPNIRAIINTHRPMISAEDAIVKAAAGARVEVIRKSSSQGLVYFPLSFEEVRLAWEVTVEDDATPNLYRSVVDAVNGEVLWRRNLTDYGHIDAHGPVFTSDSPDPDTPQGSSTGCCVSRADRPFSGVGFFPHEDDHYDWWNGAARTTTISNNVSAQEDRDGDDAGGFRPTAGAGEDFTFVLDLTLDPSVEDATTQNQSSAIVNLFYWNNRLHDIYYRLGFDENAGNFQTDNFGLGGSDDDAVFADAQDNRDGGKLCNANFQTPDDGTAPRMQMFQCDNSTPERDGDLENLVIIHEYTHGVSNRLITDLMVTQGKGMGEGWSDFFGLAITSEADDDLTLAYPRGQWFYNNVNGNRSSPYSTDLSIYPRTYSDLNDASSCSVKVCSNDATMSCDEDDECGGGNTCDKTSCSFQFDCEPPATTISQGPCVASVHRSGEIWANALWSGRANLVWKLGFAVGGQTMLQVVVDGMKETPDDPDMLDARDGILMADQATYGGVNTCLLWDGFARMGLGFSALSLGSGDINVLEAFDTPSTCTPNIQLNAPQDLGDVCDEGFSTEHLEVFNTGTGELIVYSVSNVAGSSDITVDALPEVPAVITADAHVDWTVRCEPTSVGSKSATIRIESNDPDQPTIDLEYTCNRPLPGLATVIADGGDFGNVCRDNFWDLNLTLSNTGGCDLTVDDISSDSSLFLAPGVMNPPIVIEPGDSVPVPIRFQTASATSFGAKNAIITITHDAPGSPKDVPVSANVPPGDIEVTGSTDFGDICAGDLAEKTVSVCNLGLCTLELQNAEIVDCLDGDGIDDFTIINPPDYPAPISKDFCLDLVVRFTPSSIGFKQCTLRITTDDPDEPVVDKILTGNTPEPMIDVPPDQPFPPTVIQSVASCSSSNPFPVSNIGQCNLTITDVSVTTNDAEYSLSGLPSFPIILEPGHIAGSGDLETVFGPDLLERIRTGEVTVTYISEPILGLTTEVPRQLCGEGVRTGARVLVVHGGVPVADVHMIKLQRLGGNRNRNRLDTVDQAMNLVPLTEIPAAPCPAIQYHREYSTVTNQIQLEPGSYQVSVMARIDGKMTKRVVGFDVDSCGFNATIVVDL